MLINTKYDIFQIVGIIALKNYRSQIYQIRIDGNTLYYDIEYWDGMELKRCSLCEHELSEDVNEVAQ